MDFLLTIYPPKLVHLILQPPNQKPLWNEDNPFLRTYMYLSPYLMKLSPIDKKSN
jgi:hypothetical protein